MANLDALDGTAEREQSRRPACFSADDARLAMLVFHKVAWREMMDYGEEEMFGEIFEAWIFRSGRLQVVINELLSPTGRGTERTRR